MNTKEELVAKVKKENPDVSENVLHMLVGHEFIKQRVHELSESGKQISEICDITGLYRSTVRKLLAEK